ncbi:MAG: beta-aspartyl-peptidase [Deltaproteobacteria bacterium]|nr:beta-aspartyl-peptidase [Deltaproteobacteria bacterium]
MTLLRNAQVFAPGPRGRCDLLIGGGQILAIDATLPAVALAEEIDLRGARLIPGLIDGHVHVTGGGGESGFASRVPPIALSELTRAGITTVIGLLGTDGTTRTIADLVARTLGLREEGLSAWCYTGSYQCPPHTLTGSVRGDIVFVDPILGVGELAISDHRSSQPSFEELVRVAADCHVAGLTSGKAGHVHLHLGDGTRGLDLVRRAIVETELPARVFQPTHVNRNRRLFEESVALAIAHGLPIDVTAFPADDDGYDAPTAIARCLAAPGFPAQRLTCSSDGAGCLPVFDRDGVLVEMDIGRPATLHGALVALLPDFALERVLPVFTANVAQQLRLGRKGRIEVGADADLVVLAADHGIDSVMARGRWMVRAGQPMMLGMFERSSTRPPSSSPAGAIS